MVLSVVKSAYLHSSEKHDGRLKDHLNSGGFVTAGLE